MNSILFLPTGSGKTYIATMLIKEMGESLIKYVNICFKYNKNTVELLFLIFLNYF